MAIIWQQNFTAANGTAFTSLPAPGAFSYGQNSNASSNTTVQGNRGRLIAGGLAWQYTNASVDIPINDDMQIRGTFQLGETGFAFHAITLRFDGNWNGGSPWTGYVLVINAGASAYELSKNYFGTGSSFGSQPMTWSTTATYSFAFEVVGTSLRAKVWDSTQAEPGWVLTATDSDIASGVAGLSMWNGQTSLLRSIFYDNLTIDNLAVAGNTYDETGYATILYFNTAGTDQLHYTYTELTLTTSVYSSITGMDAVVLVHEEPYSIQSFIIGDDSFEQGVEVYDETNQLFTFSVFHSSISTVEMPETGDYTVYSSITGMDNEVWNDFLVLQEVGTDLAGIELYSSVDLVEVAEVLTSVTGFDLLDVQSAGILLSTVTVTGIDNLNAQETSPVQIRVVGSGTAIYIEAPEVLSYQIVFTPEDNTSTQVDYEVWTGAGQTGELLLSGTAPTGSEHTSPVIEETGLTHGENYRYLRVTDVQGNTAEYMFIVNAFIGETYEEALGEQLILNMTTGMDSVNLAEIFDILGVSATILGEITMLAQEVAHPTDIHIYQESDIDYQIMELTGSEDIQVTLDGVFGSIWTESQAEAYTTFIDGPAWAELTETGEVFELHVLTDSDSSKLHLEYDPYDIRVVVSGIEVDPGDADSAFILIFAQVSAQDIFDAEEFIEADIEARLSAEDGMVWTEQDMAQLWTHILGADQHDMLEDDVEVISIVQQGSDNHVWSELGAYVSELLLTGSTEVFEAVDFGPTVIDFSVGGIDTPAVSEVTGSVDIYVLVEGKDRIPLRVFLRLEDTSLIKEIVYTSDLMTMSPYDGTTYHEVTYTADIEVIQ